MGGIQIQNQPREVSIALSATEAAQGRDESTEREPAAFHINVGGQWLVGPADRPRTGDQPGDGWQICPAEPVKTSHSALRLESEFSSKPAILPAGSENLPVPKPAIVPSGLSRGRRSQCEAWRARIEAAVLAGLSAQRIYQDLVLRTGFHGRL